MGEKKFETMGGNPCGSTDQVIDLCAPPEVCANLEDNKREHLIKHTTEDGTNFVQKTVKRDKALFVAILLMAIVLHVPYLKFTLYPFMIFSTWGELIECCVVQCKHYQTMG